MMPRARRLLAWLVANDVGLLLGAALLPLWLHRSYLQLQGDLPWDDAPGHLTLLMRWDAFLFADGPLVRDPFPPALYALSALCMRGLGSWLAVAEWAVVWFASALSVGACRLGTRLGGRWGGVLLPLLVAAAPAMTTYSRVYMLDLPATATVAWVVVCAWESDGFRRPWPTLGFGVSLALAVLTKYSILAWVVPFVVFPALLMLVREPIAALPLGVVAAPLGWVALALRERFLPGAGPALHPQSDILTLEGVLIVGAALLAAARMLAGRASQGWRRGMLSGIHLALATVVFAMLVLPWVWIAANEITNKLTFDVAKERQSASFNWWAAGIDLRMAWPATHAWLALAGIAALVEAGLRATRLSARPWVRRLFDVPVDRTPAVLFLGMAALAAAIGTDVTASTLSTNTRYYLPLHLFAAAGITAGLCRLRASRWLLVPALSLVCVAQILGSAGVVNLSRSPIGALRLDDTTPREAAPNRLTFYLPRAPDPSGLRPALERSLGGLRSRLGGAPPSWKHFGQRCGSVGYVTSEPLEGRRLTALAELHGLAPCVWVPLPVGAPLGEAPPQAVLFLGTTRKTIDATLPALVTAGGQPWQARFSEPLPGGKAVELYTP